MNIYISFVIYNKRYNYSKMVLGSIRSLIKTGFPVENILCLVYGKKAFNFLRDNVPNSIIFQVKKKPPKIGKISTTYTAWFIKPIAHYEFLEKSDILCRPYLYVMSDVDVLFNDNPQCCLSLQEEDVWSRASERFLRLTNKKRLLKKNPRFINPRLNRIDELTGYMGRTRAYFFIKNKMNKLPNVGLYSDFVSIKYNIHEALIRKWHEMYCDIIRYPEYCTGDQEILCSAIRLINLSYKYGGLNFVKHFQSSYKKKLI